MLGNEFSLTKNYMIMKYLCFCLDDNDRPYVISSNSSSAWNAENFCITTQGVSADDCVYTVQAPDEWPEDKKYVVYINDKWYTIDVYYTMREVDESYISNWEEL